MDLFFSFTYDIYNIFDFKNNKLIKKLSVYNITIYIFVTSLFYNEINLNTPFFTTLKL